MQKMQRNVEKTQNVETVECRKLERMIEGRPMFLSLDLSSYHLLHFLQILSLYFLCVEIGTFHFQIFSRYFVTGKNHTATISSLQQKMNNFTISSNLHFICKVSNFSNCLQNVVQIYMCVLNLRSSQGLCNALSCFVFLVSFHLKQPLFCALNTESLILVLTVLKSPDWLCCRMSHS